MLLLLSLLASCSPTPQVVVKTIVVEGTPQVVERVVTQEVEKVVTPTPVVKDTIIWAQAGNPVNLDPTLQQSVPDYNVYAQIYDALLWRDPNGEYLPQLAESWELIDDLTWEVRIREGVRFHNGEELTADAVKFTFDRILNPDLASQLFAYNSFWDTIEVVDEHTLRLTTNAPTPQALVAFSLSRLYPVPPGLVEEQGPDYLVTNPVGTGPYKFVEWAKDEFVRLERFEDYWGTKPAFRFATIRIIPDGIARAAALLVGEVDIVHELSLTDIPLVENASGVRVEAVPGGRLAMIQFALNIGPDNELTDNMPLRDKRVRQALAHAIDTQKFVTMMGGYAQPTGSIACPACFGYDDRFAEPFEYDPDKARALLAEAGYPNGFELTLAGYAGSRPLDKETMEIVAGEWANIGVETTVLPMETTAFLEGWMGHTLDDVDAFGIHILSQNWDLDGFYLNFRSGQILSYYVNEELDEMFDNGRSTTDDEERQGYYSRIQEIAREEVFVIPLYVRHVIMGVSDEIDYPVRPDDWSFLQYARPAE
jgi:peptide/nickel transport system substrate-binding protein